MCSAAGSPSSGQGPCFLPSVVKTAFLLRGMAPGQKCPSWSSLRSMCSLGRVTKLLGCSLSSQPLWSVWTPIPLQLPQNLLGVPATKCHSQHRKCLDTVAGRCSSGKVLVIFVVVGFPLSSHSKFPLLITSGRSNYLSVHSFLR